MLGFLRINRWSASFDLSEIERLVDANELPAAEREIKTAIHDVEARKGATIEGIHLRLKLAEVQRQQAVLFRGDSSARYITQLHAAEATALGALEIAAHLSQAPSYVTCLDLLIELFSDLGNFPAMEKTAQEATRLGTTLRRPDPKKMARRTFQLGVAQHENKKPDEAIATLESAATLHDVSFGPNSLELAEVLAKTGRVFRSQAKLEPALNHLQRGLKILEKSAEPDSPELLSELHELAEAHRESGNPSGAAAIYEHALLLKLKKVDSVSLVEVVGFERSLPTLDTAWENLGRARELLEDCIAAFLPDAGPRLAMAHEILARIHRGSGLRTLEARQLDCAVNVWQSCGSKRSPDVIRNLIRRAEVMEELRKTREVTWLRERVALLKTQITPARKPAAKTRLKKARRAAS
ncbi:MAG: tetratricopeptide repeat protein [Acidobacteriota bacterium]